MFRKSLLSMIIRGAMIGSMLAVVGGAAVPIAANARTVSQHDVQNIKTQLVNVFTRQQLVSALEEAKDAGVPWQYLIESIALYTLKTGDYSMLDAIVPHLDQYGKDFDPDNSLLFNSKPAAEVFFGILKASLDLHNGDKKAAAEELQRAKEIDEVVFKQVIPYALTIRNYLNS